MARLCGLAVAVATVGVATPAVADEDADRKRAAELASEGSAFGRAGDLEQAIERFSAAERIYPRALHNCNMGLAWARLDRPARSHFFLAECRERWASEEQGSLPAWVDKRVGEAEAKLRAGAYALITLATVPADATVVVPGLTEQGFRARAVWLPAGDHEVHVSRDAFVATTHRISVRAGEAERIDVALEPIAAPAEEPPPEIAPAEEPEVTTSPPPVAPAPPPAVDRDAGKRGRRWGAWGTLALGVGLAATGAGFHVMAMDAKNEAEKHTEFDDRFIDNNETYERRRLFTLSLYGLGAAGVAVGTYLLVRKPGRREPAVGAVIGRTGGSLLVRWEL